MADSDAVKKAEQMYMCDGEQLVFHSKVVREQPMRALQVPPSSISSPYLGQLIITNFALIFISDQQSNFPSPPPLPPSTANSSLCPPSGGGAHLAAVSGQCQDVRVPLCTISRVEAKKGRFVRLHCKDFRLLQFSMPFALADSQNTKKHMENALKKIENSIKLFAYSGKLDNLFAFSHKLNVPDSSWPDIKNDYVRMGIPSEKWRFTTINQDYAFSPTYPSVLVVPQAVSDAVLQKGGSFRSKARIPILSWLHPSNQASITRASQPLVGIGGNRSAEDELLVKEIIKTNPTLGISFLDARPKVNAAANKARGAGYEIVAHYVELNQDPVANNNPTNDTPLRRTIYSNVNGYESEEAMLSEGPGNQGIEFLGIENIHVMRDAERKLKDICYNMTVEDKGWFTALEGTRWLDHVNLLISCTRKIVLSIEAGISVFTHCSDGWDRTSQLSALAMLCMDPYYRTIEGFGMLIEKEWLSAGHKFEQRYGHGDRHYDDNNRSPIFPQFIDVVWQLCQQFPTCFEFNDSMLVVVLDGLYSCQFGTFLCDTEKERTQALIKEKTISIWHYIAVHKNPHFLNPAYKRYNDYNQEQWFVASGGLKIKNKSNAVSKKRKSKTEEKKKARKASTKTKAKDKVSKPKKEKAKGFESDNNGNEKERENEAEKRRKPSNIIIEEAEETVKTGDEDEEDNESIEREKELEEALKRKDEELDRLRKLAEDHLEKCLRLKEKLSLEKKKSIFFMEKLDEKTHQGNDELELEWQKELNKINDQGDSAYESDSDSSLYSDEEKEEIEAKPDLTTSQSGSVIGNSNGKRTEDSKRKNRKGSNNRKSCRFEEPDELVEFYIQPTTTHNSEITTPRNSSSPQAKQSMKAPTNAAAKSDKSDNASRKNRKSLHKRVATKLVPFLMRRPTRAELVERNILLPTEEDAKSMDAPSTAAPQRTHALNASTSSLSEDFSDTDSDSESEPTLSEQEEVAVSLSSMPSSTHSGWNMADRRTPSANKANFLGSVSSYRSVRTLQQSEGPEQQLQQQQGAQTSSSSGRRSGTAARQHKEKRKAVLISQSSAIVGKSTKEEKGLLASWGKDATVDGME